MIDTAAAVWLMVAIGVMSFGCGYCAGGLSVLKKMEKR